MRAPRLTRRHLWWGRREVRSNETAVRRHRRLRRRPSRARGSVSIEQKVQDSRWNKSVDFARKATMRARGGDGAQRWRNAIGLSSHSEFPRAHDSRARLRARHFRHGAREPRVDGARRGAVRGRARHRASIKAVRNPARSVARARERAWEGGVQHGG